MISGKSVLTCVAALTLSISQFAAAAEDYRVCPAEQTAVGIATVQEQCGDLIKPDFGADEETTVSDIQSMSDERDAFRQDVVEYGQCVTAFINSYRRPGADATSTAPDEAACAHAWAEDQATESIREFGRMCFAFNDNALVYGEPGFTGSCYPQFDEAG